MAARRTGPEAIGPTNWVNTACAAQLLLRQGHTTAESAAVAERWAPSAEREDDPGQRRCLAQETARDRPRRASTARPPQQGRRRNGRARRRSAPGRARPDRHSCEASLHRLQQVDRAAGAPCARESSRGARGVTPSRPWPRRDARAVGRRLPQHLAQSLGHVAAGIEAVRGCLPWRAEHHMRRGAALRTLGRRRGRVSFWSGG